MLLSEREFPEETLKILVFKCRVTGRVRLR